MSFQPADVRELFPTARTFPQIIVDGEKDWRILRNCRGLTRWLILDGKVMTLRLQRSGYAEKNYRRGLRTQTPGSVALARSKATCNGTSQT